MPLEPFANTAASLPLPASGWVSWAPEVANAPASREADEPGGPVFWAGAALSLLMWACSCLLAAWSL